MDIFADAKDFSVLDVDAPVHLEGKIRAPEISIGKGVPIPLIEPGDAQDVNCEQLLGGKLKSLCGRIFRRTGNHFGGKCSRRDRAAGWCATTSDPGSPRAGT